MTGLIIKALLIVTVILGVVTAGLLVSMANKNKSFVECQGTIIRFYENTSQLRVGSYEGKAISPVIEYMVKGVRYEFIGNYCTTSMKVGDRVTVMYDPSDVSKVEIKLGLSVGPLITGLLTIASALALAVMLYLKNKGVF